MFTKAQPVGVFGTLVGSAAWLFNQPVPFCLRCQECRFQVTYIFSHSRNRNICFKTQSELSIRKATTQLRLKLQLFVCRKRSFALFFEGGEDEAVAREHVGECRPWPQQFREKKALCGLAAAAIVSVAKENAFVVVEASGTSDAGGSSKEADVSRVLGAYPYGASLGNYLQSPLLFSRTVAYDEEYLCKNNSLSFDIFAPSMPFHGYVAMIF